MKLVHAAISENKNAGWDGKANPGDQTGTEVCVRSWYTKPWEFMLRYPDKNVSANAAAAAVRLAKSNLVGYDQSDRNTLYKALKEVNFDVDAYIKSGIKTEADCSSFIYAVYCCFIPEMRSDSNAPRTKTMKTFYKKYGFEVKTDAEHLTGKNLINGDILVKPHSHTAMATDGKTDGIISPKSVLITMPELRKGSTGKAVRTLQTMLEYYGYSCGNCGVDGSFGKDTLNAVKKFQTDQKIKIDGIVGTVTYMYLLGGVSK